MTDLGNTYKYEKIYWMIEICNCAIYLRSNTSILIINYSCINFFLNPSGLMLFKFGAQLNNLILKWSRHSNQSKRLVNWRLSPVKGWDKIYGCSGPRNFRKIHASPWVGGRFFKKDKAFLKRIRPSWPRSRNFYGFSAQPPSTLIRFYFFFKFFFNYCIKRALHIW